MKKAYHLLESFKHGGGENVACNYAMVLNKIGIQSTFIARDSSIEYKKNIEDKGIKTLSKIPYKEINSADYIFVHSNKNLLRLLPFIFKLKKNKTQIIYIQHLFYPQLKFYIISFFINLICTDFIQITPITEKFIKKYIRIKVTFIANFFLNKYKKEEYTNIRNNVRKELNIVNTQKVIMFSAILKKGKGLSDFVDLAYKFKDDNNYIFTVVGDGPEKYIVDNYKEKNLVFIGLVNDVERYLIASDIYFFPSKKEMLPMALIEAINTDKYILANKNDVTDFLLNNNTYKNIDEAYLLIKRNNISSNFKKYDEKYALLMFDNLLKHIR